MNDTLRQGLSIAIVLLLALGFTVLPGGDDSLNVALTVLTLAFFAAIAFLGYRLYREYHFTLDSLEERERLVLYGSIALAFLTFAATQRLFGYGGGGVVAWIGMLALASYGVYWVYTHSQRYE